jgi:rubrerythrin
MALKGTKTEKNILTAFAGESQARNRYTIFAKKAKKEGFEQISAIFEETANEEAAHASTLFKLLEGGEIEVAAKFPAGVVGKTLDNLKASAGGENHEHTSMYPEFAKVAKEEGLGQIAALFSAIGVVEKQHEKRFKALAANMEGQRVFKRDGKVSWHCRKCGYVHVGEAAPDACPACGHPEAYFELLAENY